jgi:AraC family transcriptional regulator of adaptative response/methylated-DNA-[protein]-cysteine methyltransferase
LACSSRSLCGRTKKGLELPLDIRGTLFQQRVWQRLQKIPLGTTASYTDIAIQLGNPKAVRAVASACAANPIALLVPCHRVVRSDGSISGYRWGVENKRMLIARESKAIAE